VEITGQVLMTRQLLARILRQGLRRPMRLYRIGGVLIVACGVLAVWQGSSSWPVAAGLLVGGSLATALPEIMLWQTFRRMRLGEGQAWFYRLSPDCVSQANPLATVTVRWPQVRTATASPDAWLLRLRPGGVLAVPRAAIDPAQHARVDELFTAMGLAAPG
jgi:hypothetical protein